MIDPLTAPQSSPSPRVHQPADTPVAADAFGQHTEQPDAASASVAAWLAAMRRGTFLSAWQISDLILSRRAGQRPDWSLPRHLQWVWDGRPLRNRRVLVRCYHGLGDTIQFARFLPRLAEIARELVVWVQPDLIPLLRTLPGLHAELLPLHDGTPETDFDVDIELMEVAHALRITPQALACSVPYFAVQPERRLSDRYAVGLVARAGNWDPSRHLPDAPLTNLVDGCPASACLFSLQLACPIPGTTDASTPDLLTLSARLQALDLVISVDTMAAHLAGALGVPTWTLLPQPSDWRWMDHRADSPWYPSMRLFRQPRPGAWRPVIAAVCRSLALACGH